MEYALITGASKGIGRAIAEELASRGINVLLVARSEELLQQVAAEITARYQAKADWLAIDLSTAEAPEDVCDWCRAGAMTLIYWSTMLDTGSAVLLKNILWKKMPI